MKKDSSVISVVSPNVRHCAAAAKHESARFTTQAQLFCCILLSDTKGDILSSPLMKNLFKLNAVMMRESVGFEERFEVKAMVTECLEIQVHFRSNPDT